MKIKTNIVTLLAVLAILGSLVAITAVPASAQGCEESFSDGTTWSAPPGAGAQVFACGFQVGAIASFYFDGVKLATVPPNPEVEASDGGCVQFSYIVPTTTFGYHTIKVSDGANCAEAVPDESFFVEPIVQITAPTSKKGPVGTTVTVTGKGFNDGVGATVFIGFDGDTLFLASVPLVDSTGSFSVQGQIPPLASGSYPVWAVDKAVDAANAAESGHYDFFTVIPDLSVSPTSGLAGSNVALSGSGWIKDSFVVISFAGAGPTNVTTDVNGDIDAVYQIPTAASPGISQIRGDQEGLSATTTFTVVPRALSLTPTSGPKGTRVLVTGFNMTKGNETANIPVGQLDFGTFNWNTAAIPIDTSGTIRPTSLYIDCGFYLGVNTVVAVDSSGLVATGTFTITKPTITIDPATGPAGTTVVVRGEGWVVGKIVSVFAGGNVAQTVIPGSDGKFAGTITIAGPNPGPVAIQAKDFVTGSSVECNTSEAKTFTIPGAALTISPASGPATTTATLSGTGFRPYWPVVVSIGGFALPQQALTNAVGAFTYTFAVPGLAPGVAVIMAEDGQNTITTFFTITAAPVSISNQLAGINTVLVRVWGFFGGQWQMYDPADTAGSDLATMTAGRGYWINVSAPTTLVYGAYSYALTSGWNLIGWR